MPKPVQLIVEGHTSDGNGGYNKVLIKHDGVMTRPILEIARLLNQHVAAAGTQGEARAGIRGKRQEDGCGACVVLLEATPPISKALLGRMQKIAANASLTPHL